MLIRNDQGTWTQRVISSSRRNSIDRREGKSEKDGVVNHYSLIHRSSVRWWKSILLSSTSVYYLIDACYRAGSDTQLETWYPMRKVAFSALINVQLRQPICLLQNPNPSADDSHCNPEGGNDLPPWMMLCADFSWTLDTRLLFRSKVSPVSDLHRMSHVTFCMFTYSHNDQHSGARNRIKSKQTDEGTSWDATFWFPWNFPHG